MKRLPLYLRERPTGVFFLVWAGIFLISASWALSTPLGGSPDEPAHIIKAASVVRGQFIGSPTDAPAVTRVEVPVSLANANRWPCYAFQSDVEASCIPAGTDGFELTSATTSAGLYNPVYYAVVGWPSLFLDSPFASVAAMRLVSALVSSFFLAVTFTALMRFRAPFMAGLAFLALATPTVYFLNGAVNPNSMEITAGAALLSVLLVLVAGPTQALAKPRTLLVAAGVSAFFLANARGLSPLWMALIGVAALVAAERGRLGALLRRWDVRVTLGAFIVSVGVAGLWIISTGTLSSMGVFPGASEVTPREAFIHMLVDRSFDPGVIGVFGWLDTPAPGLVLALWSALSVGLALTALSVAKKRTLRSLLVMIAGFLLVPPIVQAASIETSGYIWQGRYTLVAYTGVMILACVGIALVANGKSWLGPKTRLRALWVFGGAVTLGQVFSVMAATKRYAEGTDGSWKDYLLSPEWTPPLGVLPWVACALIGSSIIVLVWQMRTAESTADEAAASSANTISGGMNV